MQTYQNKTAELRVRKWRDQLIQNAKDKGKKCWCTFCFMESV